MNREEWHAVLAAEPATANQVGAIHREWARLYPGCDRADRLAMNAALLGLDSLGSTTRLVMGDAGRLIRILAGIRDRAELAAAAPIEHEDQGADVASPEPRASWAETLALLLATAAETWRHPWASGSHADA